MATPGIRPEIARLGIGTGTPREKQTGDRDDFEEEFFHVASFRVEKLSKIWLWLAQSDHNLPTY
jgi:hypothetical protein